MALYPPGPSRLFQLPDLAGGQAPGDLAYLVDVSLGTNAGDASDVKSSLNDLFAEITKNITDLTVQFGNGVTGTVSAAGKGKLRYNDTAKSFQVSEDGGAYQNLLKGSGVATRVAFWSATDELSSNSDFYWDNVNERLGIGVGSTPDGPLDVLADGTALAQQWRQNAGPLRVQMILDNVPEASLGPSTNHTFHLLTNNLQRVTIENGGLVGINKTSVVQAQLQVVSQDATTETLILNSAASPSVNIAELYNDSSIRFTFSPAANLGIGLSGAGGATGAITLNGVTSGAVTITVAAAAGTWNLQLPTDDGNSGQFLQTNGSGVTTWATAVTGPASPVNSVQFNDAGAFGGSSNFLWDNSNRRLLLGVTVVNGAAPIDVLADTGTVAQQWRPNTGTPRVQMQVNSSEGILGTSTLNRFHLMSNNLIRMTVEDSGAIGINQQVPAAQLHVVSAAAGAIGLVIASAPSPSANIVEFRNDSSNRFTFGASGILTLGLASTATGQLTFAVSTSANTQTLRGGTAPAATNTFVWPNADPTAGQALTASAPAAGVVTLSWTTVSGGTTINPTDTLIPYRSSSTVFSDSQLIRLSSAITELRNITTGTTAQTFNIYGTAANNTASAPTEYVRANHSASSTAVSWTAEIATPSTTAVAGINLNITASAAVAGASVAGAAAGGSVTITAGNAARLTSGNANGGNINLNLGSGIGTGTQGQVLVSGGASASQTVVQYSAALNNANGLLIGGGNAGNGVSIRVNGTAVFAADGNVGGVAGVASNIDFLSTPNSFTGRLARLAASSNLIRIGDSNATGGGSLLVAPSTASVTGNFTVLPSNAATAAVVIVARLGVNSTGTAAAGFGAALSWSAETSTTDDTQTGLFSVFWTTATHASRTSALSFTLINNATDTEAARLSTPQSTPGSPFVLSVYDGTAPNVYTAGSFAAKLYLISPTLPAVGVAAHFSATGADAPVWQLLRGRGSNASPTAAQNGDGLGALEWAGQTSTSTNNFAVGARIRVSATENWSAGNNGCQMIFYTSNNAGTITDRMYLKETGTVRIGATAGSYNTTTLLQIGNYSSWNTDVVGAIYTGANGTKGLEIIGTNGQTANLLRIFRDSLTPDLLTLAASGVLSLRAGLNTGTTVAKVGGTIHEDVTPVSNSGTGETNLMTYSLPANTLGTDNDYLELEAWGEFTAAVSNKTVKMYFGGTVIFNTTALAFGAGAWRIKATVVRGSSTTQVTIAAFSGNTTLVTTTAQVASPGETLSSAVTIKCTGQSSAASDEVFQEGFIVKWYPASA